MNILTKIYTISFVLILSVGAYAQVQNSFMDKFSVHGFISQGYMNSSANNFLAKTSEGSFQFNELGVNVTFQAFDDLRLGVQLLSRDLGREGNNQIFVDWAFADYHWQDWLGARAGKIKMPLGLYNEYRDLDLARTSIFLPQGSYVESWRESFTALTGVGLYGSFDADAIGEFSYQVQAGIMNINEDSGLNWTIEDELNADLTKYDADPTYILNSTWSTPLEGLKLAASYFNTKKIEGKGNIPDAGTWRNRSIEAAQGVAAYANANFGLSLPTPTTYDEAQAIFGATGIDLDLINAPMVQRISDVKATWFSGEYTWQDLIVAYETFRMKARLTTISPGWGAELDPTMEVLSDFENTLGGYYLSLGYQVTDQFAASTYHSEFYTDVNDHDYVPGRLIDSAFSLRYDLTTSWIFKAELHRMDGTGVMYDADQDGTDSLKKNWYLFAGKVTYNF